MITSAENKIYRGLLKKGDGSILKAIRIDKGGGRGLIAGGIILLVFSLLLAIPCLAIGEYLIAVICVLPWILMIVIGILKKNKRNTNWLSYYQKETGYTEMELQQIDKELASPTTRLVLCRQPNAVVESYISCFVTANYMVMNGVNPYIRRLEDIIAVAFSDSTDIWRMVSLSKQDKEAMPVILFTDTKYKKALCLEIMQVLRQQNPAILCGQEIACEGRTYILERDGAELLRLYQEGRILTLAE